MKNLTLTIFSIFSIDSNVLAAQMPAQVDPSVVSLPECNLNTKCADQNAICAHASPYQSRCIPTDKISTYMKCDPDKAMIFVEMYPEDVVCIDK